MNFDVTNPFDQTTIRSYAHTSEADAFTLLARSHALHEERGAWLSAADRMAILERFAVLVENQIDVLAAQAAKEGGKPLQDSIVEIRRAVDGTRVAVREITRLTGEEVAMGINAASKGRFAHTYREPRGVVLAISAFNHPFNLIIHQVITAIAAGCPVLVKPASSTPMSCESVVALLAEAGLPPDWCQLILTTNDVTEKLVMDRRVSFLTFIGSAKVGWYLRSKLAPGASCALEHGGVAPVIVDETADLDDALPLLTRGGFYHAGQVCVSVQRVFVHEDVVKEFTERYVAAAKKLITGDPLDPKTEVGPLISTRDVDRVHAWVQEAVEGGATLLCGGEKISDTTYPPTVLINAPEDCQLSQNEVFGPVVVIYPFSDLEDAITRANQLDLFFQASVFTQDLDTALSVSRRLKGMAVMVNDHTAFRVDWMPFGGSRQSGLGLGGIGHAMRDMTVERMVVFRSKAF